MEEVENMKEVVTEKEKTVALRIAVLGREVVDAIVPAGTTVAEVLKNYGLETETEAEIRIDGRPVKMDEMLTEEKEGSVITFVPKIKGGK